MTGDATRDYLQTIGYQVRFRHHEWVECLIVGDGQAYTGRGLDRESAFRAAIALICPTPLALRLLEDSARRLAEDRLRMYPPREDKPSEPPAPESEPSDRSFSAFALPSSRVIRATPSSIAKETGPSIALCMPGG